MCRIGNFLCPPTHSGIIHFGSTSSFGNYSFWGHQLLLGFLILFFLGIVQLSTQVVRLLVLRTLYCILFTGERGRYIANGSTANPSGICKELSPNCRFHESLTLFETLGVYLQNWGFSECTNSLGDSFFWVHQLLGGFLGPPTPLGIYLHY